MAFILQRRAVRAQAEHMLNQYRYGRTASRDASHTVDDHFDEKPASLQDSREEVLSVSDLWPYATLPGVTVQRSNNGDQFYKVDWESENDQLNPRNWSTKKRFCTMVLLDCIAAVATGASSITSASIPQAAADLHTSVMLETFGSTGSYLIGFGIGAFFAAPMSEIAGRWPVYMITLAVATCWLIGAALTPNIGAQIVFRYLAGFSASAPLTVAGGSLNDLWSSEELTWAFPVFAVIGFGAPLLSIVAASYVGVGCESCWRWNEWIMVIANLVVIVLLVTGLVETLASRILCLKALELRRLTGDDRFLSALEIERSSFAGTLRQALIRPWTLALEPIVTLFTLYNSVVYIILFTFLGGYASIFEEVYGISQGLKNMCFIGLLVGTTLPVVFVPFISRAQSAKLKPQSRCKDGSESGNLATQELRLIWAMIGAPLIPAALLVMAWTARSSVSIWVPLASSIVIGFGMICIFISSYMYLIDSYGSYAASALTLNTFIRYVAAGIMTVVAIPMYKNLGVAWALTLLALLAAMIAPVPYILRHWGTSIRSRSELAV